MDWILTPNLSVQLYAQPFAAAGRYSEFKEVTDPLAHEFSDRYSMFGDALACSDWVCDVDFDADGTTDLSFGQPDFNYKSLRSTGVLRWEYRPGSVLYVAWQHGRSENLRDPTFGGFGDIVDLFTLASDNTLLVKVSYWLGF